MKTQNIYPVVLTILDGWGYSNNTKGNAINHARTPNIDALLKTYPNMLLNASGSHVGLPENQVGNSEVGHTTIGGGRVLQQDLARIDSSIQDKSFFKNTTLKNICEYACNNQIKIHIIGLCSDGGVHSHTNHLIALFDLLKKYPILNICIHLITDGRDTKPNCASNFIKQITHSIKSLKTAKICTISGRYYAMDRDCRWSRTEAFYKILTEDQPITKQDSFELINEFYSKQISDEFIIPTRIHQGKIENQDAIIFFNFRPDRMRQIVQAFKKEEFKGFPCKELTDLAIVTFTKYDGTLNIPTLFEPLKKINFLGEIISQKNLKQLRIAETEKYAHVTYFFNGGVEEPYRGEDRELLLSPQVKTYDECPEMSALQITNSVIQAIQKNIYSLIVVNYANPDMIGHTGNLEATLKAIEVIDQSVAKLYKAVNDSDGTLLITADHGNAEYMLDSQNNPCKSHTTNPVPFILIECDKQKIIAHGSKKKLKVEGCLADIAPTILDILKISQPKEMTGKTLIDNTTHEVIDSITVTKDYRKV